VGFRRVFVLGGARSGKSTFAERLASESGDAVLYVATARPSDEEMGERIAQHRARRDERWQTVEAPRALADAVRNAPADQPLLIDCLTLWLSNRLLGDADLDQEMSTLSEALALRKAPTVVVANEAGLGIVPDNTLARRFRDAAGKANQMVAAQADRVEFVAAGLALRLK
jgi:adenosylcobinamide kinase/adenosylcobinamide-phosphate guanylyltransferase